MHSFKKALLAALGFIACVILFAGILVWPYFHGESYYYEDARVRDELAGSVDTIISGASHGYCAFDSNVLDEELGTSTYNLSGPMMTMRARDTLLKKELDRNPVKTVFIEASCNMLVRNRHTEGPEGDIYALPRMGSLPERLSYFFAAFEPEEYLTVCADTLDRGLSAWKALLSGEGSKVDGEARGFLRRDSHDLSLTPEEFSELHNRTGMDVVDRWDNKEYLWDMVETCQARGIEVIFVATPMSDRMLAEYNNLETPYGWMCYYSKKYGCPFLDFNLYRRRDELFDDRTAFFDGYHLSSSGAEIFTRELAEVCRRIESGQDVSSLFFADYYEMDEAMTAAYGNP